MLSHWYNLSDVETEASVSDRLSFRRFLPIDKNAPDHSTISRFRDQLIKNNKIEELFSLVNSQLNNHGLIIKQGTLIDASIIAGGSNDKEGGAAGKTGVYGYKLHIAVESESGYVRKVDFTAANINDQLPAKSLLSGDERCLYTDKGYDSKKLRSYISSLGIEDGIMRRIYPQHHSKEKMNYIHYFNNSVSKTRRKVEMGFGIIPKLVMGEVYDNGKTISINLLFRPVGTATLSKITQ